MFIMVYLGQKFNFYGRRELIAELDGSYAEMMNFDDQYQRCQIQTNS